jgi:hypothetical protein
MARVAYTSSPPTATAFGSLSKDVSELRVIFSFISVMDTYVSIASVNLAQIEFFRAIHTFSGYLASDTCVRGLNKTGIRIQATDAQAHVVSFHSCV